MISKLTAKILVFIKENPGHTTASMKHLTEGCRCGGIGAILARMEADELVARTLPWNRAYIITEKGEKAIESYEFMKGYRVDVGLSDLEDAYKQMEELAYNLLIALLHVPDDAFKNGITNEEGTIDQGSVMAHQFIHEAAAILGVDLTQPIKPREKK